MLAPAIENALRSVFADLHSEAYAEAQRVRDGAALERAAVRFGEKLHRELGSTANSLISELYEEWRTRTQERFGADEWSAHNAVDDLGLRDEVRSEFARVDLPSAVNCQRTDAVILGACTATAAVVAAVVGFAVSGGSLAAAGGFLAVAGAGTFVALRVAVTPAVVQREFRTGADAYLAAAERAMSEHLEGAQGFLDRRLSESGLLAHGKE